MSEQAMGTNAPGVVAATSLVTVTNGEHFISTRLHAFRCAAAPSYMRRAPPRPGAQSDGGGAAFQLRCRSRGRHVRHDHRKHRLLQAQSHRASGAALSSDASPAGTPLQALMGVAADGRVARLDERHRQPSSSASPGYSVQRAGNCWAMIYRACCNWSGQPSPAPLRLASGLGVWMQAHLQTLAWRLARTWTPWQRGKTWPALQPPKQRPSPRRRKPLATLRELPARS